MRGLSVGYKVAPGGASYAKQPGPGEARRVLRGIRLIEVSIVSQPSNPLARVSHIKSAAVIDAIEELRARIAAGDLPTEREIEKHLRDAGFSRSVAAALVAGRSWKSLMQRESAADEANEAAVKAARNLRDALDGISFPSLK
jgi:hypothetical protein